MSKVLFYCDSGTNSPGLFTANIDGSSAVKFAYSYTSLVGSNKTLQFSPDSNYFVFLEIPLYYGVGNLYAGAMDGSSMVMVNTPATASQGVTKFEVSSDSSKIIYLSSENTNGIDELMAADIDGSNKMSITTPDMFASGDVYNFKIAPNASKVIYSLRTSDNRNKVYSANLDGTSQTRLSLDT
ncbi:MAG: hypothetical protein R2827_01310 [Bdellovibrionales bacterium]